VVTFGKAKEPLGGIGALSVTPGFSFRNCPPIDLLFVPGGGSKGLRQAILDDDLLRIIAEKARTARYVAAVCTGGLLLAAAGLLEGREATTHWAVIDCLKLSPKVKVVNGCPRYVQDGNVFTGGGISSSIDLSLFMIEAIVRENCLDKDPATAAALARAASQKVQLSIQYNPRPPYSGGDPCSVDYSVYAPVAEGMKHYHDPVCAAVAERIGRKPGGKAGNQ
jgi:cyclohexyl-isocyanide hydratase